MMAGLQGAGKTTTTAKLAGKLKSRGKKSCLAALDAYRPAALAQLQINRGRHPVREKRLQILQLFAHAHIQDRLSGDCLDRQGRAAPRVSVQLCQDHAVD